MDETKPPADGANAGPQKADPDEPLPEASTCQGAVPAQPAEATPEAGPGEADGDWFSL